MAPLASPASPFAASIPDVSAHKLSLSVVALSLLPAQLETVLQRFMPVQNFQCVVPEPDVYPKHKDKDIFVHLVSSPTEFFALFEAHCGAQGSCPHPAQHVFCDVVGAERA